MSNYIYKGGELYHYGTPGMKWGHRKARPEADISSAGRNKAQDFGMDKKASKAEAKRQKSIQKNFAKINNETAKTFNKTTAVELQKKYAKYDFNQRHTDPKVKKAYEQYVEEYCNAWNKAVSNTIAKKYGGNPSGDIDMIPTSYDRQTIEDMKRM